MDIYFSFFMFTTDLRLSDPGYRRVILRHMKELKKRGYAGVELPIGQGQTKDYAKEIEEFAGLRRLMDDEGLADLQVATNVAATEQFDPSAPDPARRQKALEYLESRIDVTAALRGAIMMGPVVVPYNAFPTSAAGTRLWSDRLQDHLDGRYANAQPVLARLGAHAERRNVKVAIEPITHWETPGPNTLAQLLRVLDGVPGTQVGVVIDCAHEVLDGDGPTVFQTQVSRLAAERRLHYVQISPPDRGAVHTSWIPWQAFLGPILRVYDGPIAVEIFNAIPVFLEPLRITRRKFWIPGEDEPDPRYPDAYTIAAEAIEAMRAELGRIR